MAKVSMKYLDLIRSFPLRPIKSEGDLRRAETMLHQLLDEDHLVAAEKDYLEILGTLIEEYERAAHPTEALPPPEMLKVSMEAKGVTQTEVSKATGIPNSTISDLLARKREFNVAHIGSLCAYFGLGPSAFIQVQKPELTAR